MAFPVYRISVNGKEFSVTVLSVEGNTLSFSAGGKRFDVAISEGAGAYAPAVTSHAAPPPPVSAPSASPSAPAGAIVAPIPGLLSRILVSVGDEVAAGQTVAVLEAMKMENNIASPFSGIVAEIPVREGAEVNGRQLLIRLQ